MWTRSRVVFAVTAVLAGVSPAGADCQADRFRAADRYTTCRHRASVRFPPNPTNITDYQNVIRRCTTRYLAAWPKIQARAAGTTSPCNGPRFVDNANGTVTDNLTGLQWEQKTDDSSIHDKDNRYTWSATGTAADGSGFLTFLATLNQSGSCTAGQCDWRLPTPGELQTTLVALPCPTDPCIDQSIFGPTLSFPFWSSMTAPDPSTAWALSFVGGGEFTSGKDVLYCARAVRGGL